jgi:hypothetical protein
MPQTYYEQKYMHRAIVRLTPKITCSFPRLEKLRLKVTEDDPIQSDFWVGQARSLPLSEIETFARGLANAFANPQLSRMLTTTFAALLHT